MKNIPVFATEYGVASLILKEIPYRAVAYIILQDTQDPEELLQECLSFCRAAGADAVYAAGNSCLKKYSFHTSIWEMAVSRNMLSETDAQLIPVTEETLQIWRDIYNHGMEKVPNASYMDVADSRKMLLEGTGYYVRRADELLGIGMVSGDKVAAVVSVKPGAGETILLALNRAAIGERLILEVASANERALRLYWRMGFTLVAEKKKWYKIL